MRWVRQKCLNISVSLEEIIEKDKYSVSNSLVVMNVSRSKHRILSIIRENRFGLLFWTSYTSSSVIYWSVNQYFSVQGGISTIYPQKCQDPRQFKFFPPLVGVWTKMLTLLMLWTSRININIFAATNKLQSANWRIWIALGTWYELG